MKRRFFGMKSASATIIKSLIHREFALNMLKFDFKILKVRVAQTLFAFGTLKLAFRTL
ncbi:MAG: hypothetical protein LBL74_08675 [Bacteroidales bacterium]|nr:hypothetical protein [Bacteroidales bacterium]